MYPNHERKISSWDLPIEAKIASIFFIVSMLVVFTGTVSVFAQSGSTGVVTDDQVNAIAKQLYCPVCENIPLDVCGTQACAQWRELIREKLSQGWTEGEIKTYFVDQYGDRVLDEPPLRGLNWLVYIVPPVAFLLGAYFLVVGVRSWRKPGEVPQSFSTDDELDNEYLSIMEEQIKEID